MRLLKAVQSLFSPQPKEHIAAIDQARKFFAQQYGKQDLPSWAHVIASVDEAHIVRLCYGHTKPPRRAYFAVEESGSIRELDFDQVRKFGERPWR